MECTRQSFVPISSRLPACSRMSTQGTVDRNGHSWKACFYFDYNLQMGEHVELKWRGWPNYRSRPQKREIQADSVVVQHFVGLQVVSSTKHHPSMKAINKVSPISRVVPWGCTSGFLRRLVPDANPQHHLAQGSPSIAKTEAMQAKNTNSNSKDSILIQRMTATAFGERVL